MDEPAIAVTGSVARERCFTAADLEQVPSVIAEIAGRIDGGTGRAVCVGDLIDPALPDTAATHATIVSSDGYRASVPLGLLRTGGWLAFGGGEGPLTAENGGPFRLTVADGSTLCWNVKRVAELHVTVGPEPDDVPEKPPH